MTRASDDEALLIESALLEAIGRLQSRRRSLSPLEQVKLHSLLYNLKAIRAHAQDAPCDEPADEKEATIQFVASS